MPSQMPPQMPSQMPPQMPPQMQQQMQQIAEIKNELTKNKVESILYKETYQGTTSHKGVLVKMPTGDFDFCFFSEKEGMFFITIKYEYEDGYKYITNQRGLQFHELMLAYTYSKDMAQAQMNI